MSVLTGRLKPMRQEGAQLVRRPLPIYPHVKTIQSDDEGMEVASLLGTESAILLRGHGAVTAEKSLSEAVMSMAHLEEQAQMNYLAYCAEGKDYSYLGDDVWTKCLIEHLFTSSRISKMCSKGASLNALEHRTFKNVPLPVHRISPIR